MALALSNVAASATATLQQKDQLPNPFELQDSQILHKVYLTHVNDDKECDKNTLLNLVHNTLVSAHNSASSGLQSQTSVESFKPDFPILKRIFCQMIMTRGTPECAHQTTLKILRQLSGFSWDVKAIITLAAFSLEYGEFWRLNGIQTTELFGNSLKQLNQVQSRNVTADMIDLVTVLVEVLSHFKDWAKISASYHDVEEVRSLAESLQHIPLVVYWTIAAIVASAGNLVGVSNHTLSKFKSRLYDIDSKLKTDLDKCRFEITKIDDVKSRFIRVTKIKNVVDLFDVLFLPGPDNGTPKPKIFEAGVEITTGIQVFKQKHVMVFISGLESILDEILVLNSIYKRLQENPGEEVKGVRKGDLKILWVPIVREWKIEQREQFKKLKEGIKWNVLEYYKELPGLAVLTEIFKYDIDTGKPIVSVINPQGQIINQNAMQVIFEWGIEAFPFTSRDGEDLNKKWSWFWKLLEKTDPEITTRGKDNTSYIFIYGGNDSTWVQNFSAAIAKINQNERIKNADFNIDRYQLGEGDPDKVPCFWIGIDGKKQNKECKDTVDCEIQKVVKTLLCLKQDPLGWVLLSRGRNLKILGHAEPMYQTVADFEKWKYNVVEEETFDVAFNKYYDTVKERYAHHPYDYSSSVLATIVCPNPMCERVMNVTSVNYRCCHGTANSCSI
ncbi:hypothetical protein Fmac_024169 [Flemingia macrophylla]|uniref:Uncharacterized protein n=1 Tax=Flemingia macrophylla TaxID=520843 RepID=A0ABD1LNM5_9FABA